MRLSAILSLAALVLGSCDSSAEPGAAAVNSAYTDRFGSAAPLTRNVACSFDEESGLWICRFEAKDADGRWSQMRAELAEQGDRWVLVGKLVRAP